MIEFIVVALWFACGVAQWGLMHAFFVRRYPGLAISRLCDIALVPLGPVALVAAVIFLVISNGFKKAFKYGFKL